MKKAILILGLLLLPLFVASSASAGQSAHYRVDWSTQMTGSGGEAASTGHRVGLTAGQTVIGPSSGAHYRVSMGYWPAVRPDTPLDEYRILLPFLQKSP